ncbi:MAG: glycosyltransferase [Reyranella sp.]|uniref:glycosyltransferase n=1 Tax=Reyranella sp. TaxID=1929291 RepID=UPI001AC21D79|nr:glycosyltransferase [Reyranella sp.]MBN9088921.1 glycosyltransferase [Reyranella sp.]
MTPPARVAHCVGFYFPDQVGGTEVYVQDLLSELAKLSVDGHVVAATNERFREYEWEGIRVARYPSNWADVREYAPSRPHAGLSKFQELVLENRPDIFHLHSWTSGAGLEHLSQIARLGIPCVVTMHVPSALCMRGTMLLHGRKACDGLIEEKRCAQCWSEQRGLPSSIAFAMSRLPRMSFAGGSTSKVLSRAVTLLSARSRALVQAHELRQMADLSEVIVAPSGWVHDGLLANGIAADKLTVSRQGVTLALVREAARTPPRPKSAELKVGFIGRLEHYKGAHILIEAMNRLPPQVPARLLIAGSGTEPHYLKQLTAAWDGDKRIEFLGPITRGEVPDFLRRLDVLAVPSNYMETGPLVVLEAQVFGIPVMGADLGGISERIRDGVDGWLLPFDDSGAWAAAIQEIALDRGKLEQRAAGVGRTRTMADVAGDMAELYRSILQRRPEVQNEALQRQ